MSGCEKYAELMNRYLDGDLPASQISDLLDHLDSCASCRNRFDALKIMAFEMRHMQIEPPKALHGQIMEAARRSTQRRPRSCLKTAFALAACAAALVLTINGTFFQLADNYLFNAGSKSAPTEMADRAADDDAPADAEGQMEAAPAQGGEEQPSETMPFAAPSAGSASADLPSPASLPASEGGQSAETREDAGVPMPLNEEAAHQEASADPPAGTESDAQPKLRQAQMEESQKASLDQGAADLSQPFRVPSLDTDEVFAFYCVAMGEGSIPNAFDQNEIVRFPDKKCMYIYVQTTQFTQKGCENLLSQSGFTIREGANLPETDESMPYGLIIIYEYEAR